MLMGGDPGPFPKELDWPLWPNRTPMQLTWPWAQLPFSHFPGPSFWTQIKRNPFPQSQLTGIHCFQNAPARVSKGQDNCAPREQRCEAGKIFLHPVLPRQAGLWQNRGAQEAGRPTARSRGQGETGGTFLSFIADPRGGFWVGTKGPDPLRVPRAG